ncbi:MAG: diphosphomevalonate decarboxylase [Bifidobacterium aquikefiri]|uniref:diphosphomevalonate decarboxylase n=1 Tax=Bifidobacterium aquikefiri TaxID=1653207 RepID=A0A261GAZ2_9BIFI|nr:diphosphomevalonate decarboxylase [Bifidobacterium aquikefiri]OZG68413.1 dihydrofolate reductase [Bifidobacterium aquikefiri]
MRLESAQINAQIDQVSSGSMQATASANANIALVKYWGKADESLIIPNASSLSLTVDGLSTTTQVTFHTDTSSRDLKSIHTSEECSDASATSPDTLIIDGERHQGKALHRVSSFLDRIRELSGIHAPASVISHNTVPYAAGLASSASAFAALAAAASRAAGLNLDDRYLSRLARCGSGSASRSIYAGLAVWQAGHDDATSYAEPIASLLESNGESVAAGRSAHDFGMQLAMIVILISDKKKAVSSRVAMRRSVETSPLYGSWIQSCTDDLQQAITAVSRGDVEMLGVVTERNSYGMHATMMTAQPPVLYWQPETVEALHAVEDVRASGLGAWSTMDAGPNVKVLTSAQDAVHVCEALRERMPQRDIHIHMAGEGVRILDQHLDI